MLLFELLFDGKVFTATACGNRPKQVVCEKCGARFQYKLSRLGTGSALAPWGLGQRRAMARAQHAANRDLEKKLAWDHELVPCPACKWVNPLAIAHVRGTRHHWWPIIAGGVILWGALLDILFYAYYQDVFERPRSIFAPELCIISVSAVAVALVLLWIYRMLLLRIDPNSQTVKRPKVLEGTPPAMIEINGPRGEPTLAVVPSDYSNLQSEAHWATFRPGQLVFEPLCCRCLAPATVEFQLPVVLLDKILPVPLCRQCLCHLRRKWRSWNLAMLPMCVAAAWAIMSLPWAVDKTLREAGILMVAAVFGLLGSGIIQLCIQPYRLQIRDHRRGIRRIRFRNNAYTALLIRKIGEADGLYKPVDSESTTDR